MADVTTDFNSILSYLKCHKRLEREKGLSKLRNLIELGSVTSRDYSNLETSLLDILTCPEGQWEEIHGVLMATNLLIERERATDEFKRSLMKLINSLMENSESRIRLITGNHHVTCGHVTSY